MSGKKSIPLERLLLDKGYERNIAIERKSAVRDQKLIDALDEEKRRNAVENIRRRDASREGAYQAKIAQGAKTKKTIRNVMARHRKDATNGEIWPAVESKLLMKIGKRHAYEVMNEIRREQKQSK